MNGSLGHPRCHLCSKPTKRYGATPCRRYIGFAALLLFAAVPAHTFAQLSASTGTLRYVPATVQTEGAATADGAPTSANAPVRARTSGLRYAPYTADSSTTGTGDWTIVDFPQGAVSGTFLRLDEASQASGTEFNVDYQSLDPDAYHYFSLWRSQRDLWQSVGSRQINKSAAGSIPVTQNWPGEYKACIDAGPDRTGYSARPDDATECVEFHIVWGDPQQAPSPMVTASPTAPVAGQPFTLSWEGMPASDSAHFRLQAPTDGVDDYTAYRWSTNGAASGSASATVFDPGDYELRVFYENLGRQIRAVRRLTILPP